MKILLDYFMPVSSIIPTPAASTAFLKQVIVVVSPKDGGVTTGVLTECTSKAAVALLTNNTEADELFDAGMNRVFILPMDDLDLEDALDGHESDAYTLLISSDFDKDDITAVAASGNITITSYANLVSGTDDSVGVAGVTFTAQTGAVTEGAGTFQAATSNDATATSLAAQINAHATAGALVTASALSGVVTITAKNTGSSGNAIALAYTDNDTNVGATKSGATLSGGIGLVLGGFSGVVGVSESDDSFLATQAAILNRVAFHADEVSYAKNMFYAFGKLLSNSLDWLNQQYITVPYDSDVTTLGDAESLFDDKISFVISDSEFGNKLSLFAAGGQAIAAPYIKRNLEIDMQSAALTYISGNMPQYTKVQAALIEDELQKVINGYIRRMWIELGVAQILLEEENFVGSAYINISEPKALWRIFGEIRQTL